MLKIDGSLGEGGGQILRTSLALSMCLQKPFEINNIRSGRERPGLQPQHLAAVKAAAAICNAETSGANRDSQRLLFIPGRLTAGRYHFDIGTAGSTTLVLQTLLPALMLAGAPSTLSLQGGTHNPFAPPYEFINQSFIPLLQKMGPRIKSRLEHIGFAPRGGGRLAVEITPVNKLQPLILLERGKILRQYAQVLLSHLPQHIASRELKVIGEILQYQRQQLLYTSCDESYGPGNAVMIVIQSELVTAIFTAFGQKGKPAEQVAHQVADEARHYLNAGVPVDSHLADQLLVPIALAGKGTFVTQQPSLHCLTNMNVIKQFMRKGFTSKEVSRDVWEISLS